MKSWRDSLLRPECLTCNISVRVTLSYSIARCYFSGTGIEVSQPAGETGCVAEDGTAFSRHIIDCVAGGKH